MVQLNDGFAGVGSASRANERAAATLVTAPPAYFEAFVKSNGEWGVAIRAGGAIPR
jgi:hypothetical protein